MEEFINYFDINWYKKNCENKSTNRRMNKDKIDVGVIQNKETYNQAKYKACNYQQ